MEFNAEKRRQVLEGVFVKCASFQAEERDVAIRENQVTWTTAMQRPNFSYSKFTVHICKEKVLGMGSFGTVSNAKVDNFICATKFFHPALTSTGLGESASVAQRFQEEYKFLSTIRHPSIIQYLGVYKDPNLPTSFPFHVDFKICGDVAQALAYLHSNRVIHRGLSCSDVLLMGNPHKTKVSDFGIARLPLKALGNDPYGKKLDRFSYGVILCESSSKTMFHQEYGVFGSKSSPIWVQAHVKRYLELEKLSTLFVACALKEKEENLMPVDGLLTTLKVYDIVQKRKLSLTSESDTHGKVKKAQPSARYCLCGYRNSQWHIWSTFLCDIILWFCFISAVICTPLSLNNNLNGSLVACPGQQVRFECLANSPELYWSSPEYIGEPPGVRIEFSGEFHRSGTIARGRNAVATLLIVNAGNVMSSELVITASQDFPTASITCGRGNHYVTNTFQVSSGPGTPQNVRASISASSGDNCVVLLRWNLPTDMTTSLLVVNFADGILEIPPQVTVAALPIEKCNLNAIIGIHAVDVCGQPGARVNVILKDVLQDSGNITECPSQTTAASQANNSTCLLCDDSAMTWIIAFSVVIGIMIIAITAIVAGISINMLTHAQNFAGKDPDMVHKLLIDDYHQNLLKSTPQDSERHLKIKAKNG